MPADTATTEGRALLQLPRLETLTERQVRGIDCVFDGIPLAPLTPVDLGPRAAQRAGQTLTWYPRACPRCTAEAAFRALHQHAPECGERGEDITCPACRGLLRLIREGHRR
jgi:hypothetical protein